MSLIQTIPPRPAVEYTASGSPHFTGSPYSYHEQPTPPQQQYSWNTNNLLASEVLADSASLHHHRPVDRLSQDDERIFPSLPPLERGHPDVHLRMGIMKSAEMGAENELNAEKAFFVADLTRVYLQHQRFRNCLPEVQPFYAVKCNPDPYVLRLLAALGAGFDCASNNEIAQVLALGIDPSRLIYANPCKPASFIRNATKHGVDTMTFDNVDELHKIARIHPHSKLVIRILTDDSKSICRMGIKFGATVETVPSILQKAKELGLDIVGVTFNVGSGCYDPSVYTDAIRLSRTVFDMGKDEGYNFKLLDVGGGFEDTLFEQAASIIRAAIQVYFPRADGLKVIAEPGRFYVSTAFSLATNIIARRQPHLDISPELVKGQGIDKPIAMYYISDGVYGAFNCILFDHQEVHPYVLSLNGSFHVSSSEPMQRSSVWGPTCDSMDLVCPAVELPRDLQVGDWLGFRNMGAYTICAASQFNGFEVSKVVYTVDGPRGTEVRNILAAFASEGHGL